jgi:hypothetical protein
MIYPPMNLKYFLIYERNKNDGRIDGRKEIISISPVAFWRGIRMEVHPDERMVQLLYIHL